MKWQFSRRPADDSILNQITEGMLVRDEDNLDIGKVKRVFLGSAEDESRHPTPPATNPAYTNHSDESFLQALDGAIAAQKNGKAPGELYDYMAQHGFILVDTTGLLSRDYFALPDQIDSVLGGIVFLRLNKADLNDR